ncbi:MAG: flagellar basal body rod protein FlgC [bacterium]|jgi:flagellar basal-body rod protein FlgC
MGGMFEILDTASNSLKTEREAMGYAAENVANMYTPGYKAKTPILMAKGRGQSFSEMVEHLAEGREIPLNAMLLSKNPGSGSMIGSVAVDPAEGTQLYLPNHPLANAQGYVESSNVNGPAESVKMLRAVTSYKAILSIVEMTKASSKEALNMTKNG